MNPTKPLTIAAAVSVLVLAGACSFDPSAEQRLSTLEQVYQQGVKAAASMRSHGIVATEASCQDMWKGSGLAERDTITRYGSVAQDENKTWQRQRATAYLNGCLGRANDINATPRPSDAGVPS